MLWRRVYVEGFGSMVGKRKGRLYVRSPKRLKVMEVGQKVFDFMDDGFGVKERVSDGGGHWDKGKKKVYELEVPFFRVKELVIEGRGVSISSDVIEELCSRNVPVHFIRRSGRSVAMLLSPDLVGMVKTRRAQVRAYGGVLGVEYARSVVIGKMRNQAALLKYFGKYKGREGLEEILKGLGALVRRGRRVKGRNVEEVRGKFLMYESQAGRLYWEGVKILSDGKFEFEVREKRGARDSFNVALNYGYGILRGVVTGALQTAGLDPYAGFLHTDRSGRPSLVLDAMEEFRQPVVDRAVISLFDLGVKVGVDGNGLDDDGKKAVRDRVYERLESKCVFRGRRWSMEGIVQRQARSLAVFLRGDGRYRPYVMKW